MTVPYLPYLPPYLPLFALLFSGRMAESKTMKWKVLALVCVCIIVGALGLLWKPLTWGSKVSGIPTPEQLAHCATVMQVNLPPGTRGIGMTYQYWQDPYITLVVDMSVQEWKQFKTESPFANAVFSSQMKHVTQDGDRGPMWQIDKVRKFESAEVTAFPDVWAILADLDGPRIVRVYFVYFRT